MMADTTRRKLNRLETARLRAGMKEGRVPRQFEEKLKWMQRIVSKSKIPEDMRQAALDYGMTRSSQVNEFAVLQGKNKKLSRRAKAGMLLDRARPGNMYGECYLDEFRKERYSILTIGYHHVHIADHNLPAMLRPGYRGPLPYAEPNFGAHTSRLALLPLKVPPVKLPPPPPAKPSRWPMFGGGHNPKDVQRAIGKTDVGVQTDEQVVMFAWQVDACAQTDEVMGQSVQTDEVTEDSVQTTTDAGEAMETAMETATGQLDEGAEIVTEPAEDPPVVQVKAPRKYKKKVYKLINPGEAITKLKLLNPKSNKRRI